MQLPKGITGFWSGDTEPPPFLDEKAFRQLCHTLARETGGTVTEMDTAAGGNFYFAGIRRYDDTVFVLQNRHFPYAAFARRGPSGRMVFTGVAPVAGRDGVFSEPCPTGAGLPRSVRGAWPGRAGAAPLLEAADRRGDPI